MNRPLRLASSAFLVLVVADLFWARPAMSQTAANWGDNEPPALVVGIMVDQMRPDFITRYWDTFGEGGFKRLFSEGFRFSNAHFEYVPTATGAGHASVYTGTVPSVHGAIGNSWYVRDLGRSINVIENAGYGGVGSAEGYDGAKGPGNMLTTTLGDELRLHSNWRSKVVGISRKDRGAILPAGHTGDAYWYEAETGHFITSTYYKNELPQWLTTFNERGLASEYLSRIWETYLPIDQYIASGPDESPYEGTFRGRESTSFPYDLPLLVSEQGYNYGLLSSTPFSDDLLGDLAIAAIEGEHLGQRGVTDLLSVSFSAPDAIGHRFGPASVEVQDAFVRLDRTIERLLTYLDGELGRDNVLVFLTSDHGVTHVPGYLSDHSIPAGQFDTRSALAQLREHFLSRYGHDLALSISNLQVYLDHAKIDEHRLDHLAIQRDVARFILSLDGVAGALTAEALSSTQFTRGVPSRVQNGYNQKRSGDVVFWLEPQIISGTRQRGTTHGSPWAYDAHAPLLWYGWNIAPGTSAQAVSVADIAPTIAIILGSPLPSGSTGAPLNDYLLQK
jgi:predicted AlkP superfamily pyrophosphatase or phosphodiesterase